MAAVLVNGVNWSWANLNHVAFGVPVIGILAINYKVKQNKENNYGVGNEPISRGYGNREYEGSITVYKDWLAAVIAATPTKQITDIAPFNWTIVLGGVNVPTTTETLRNFEFLEDSLNGKQGDTKLTIDIPFIFAGIVRS